MAEPTAREALEDKLRALLGSAGTALSSGVLQSAIDSALDDLARLRPRIDYVVVNLVPDKAEYDAPEDAYSVLDVVFPDALGSMDSDFALPWYQQFVSIGDGDLVSFHSHSLAVVIAQKWEQFENRFGFDWEYDLDTNCVLVMPVPKVESKMLLKVAYARDLESVPKKLMSAVEDLAYSASLDSVIASNGLGITSVPIGIGSVSFNAQSVMNQASAARRRGLQKLGSQGGSVIIG